MGVWLSEEKLTQEGQIKGMVKQNLLVLLLLAFFFFFLRDVTVFEHLSLP